MTHFRSKDYELKDMAKQRQKMKHKWKNYLKNGRSISEPYWNFNQCNTANGDCSLCNGAREGMTNSKNI